MPKEDAAQVMQKEEIVWESLSNSRLSRLEIQSLSNSRLSRLEIPLLSSGNQ